MTLVPPPTPPGEQPLSPRDRDLAILAATSRQDRMLGALANIGAGYTVGLLANGMTIYGAIVTARKFAEALDEENERVTTRWAKGGAPGWEEAANTLKGIWTRSIEEEEEEQRMLVEHTTGDIDELPEEVSRMIIRGKETSLTLADVHLFPPGSPHFQLPLLRVRLATVTGWWLVPSTDEGGANVSHPTAFPRD